MRDSRCCGRRRRCTSCRQNECLMRRRLGKRDRPCFAGLWVCLWPRNNTWAGHCCNLSCLRVLSIKRLGESAGLQSSVETLVVERGRTLQLQGGGRIREKPLALCKMERNQRRAWRWAGRRRLSKWVWICVCKLGRWPKNRRSAEGRTSSVWL